MVNALSHFVNYCSRNGVVKFLRKALRMAICDQDSDDPDVLKVKVKVKFTLEQVMKAQRWSKGIALLFH